jgi:hypothetical protein
VSDAFPLLTKVDGVVIVGRGALPDRQGLKQAGAGELKAHGV